MLRTAAKLGAVYIFLYTKYRSTFYHILIWSFGHNCIIDWPGKPQGNCFEFFLSKGNIFAHAGKYQLFGEHYRLYSHSFTRISNIVLEFKMCINSNTVECHFDLPPGFYVMCVNYTLKHCALYRKSIYVNLYVSFSAHFCKATPEIPAWTVLYEFTGYL